MNKINVVGLGPGNKDYILPEALQIIDNSDVIIGGKRNLKSIELNNKEILELKSNLTEITDYIKKNYNKKKICVVASGDPGFFGILKFLSKHFDKDLFNVVPGISSVQYLFAKINMNWDDAVLISLHGQDLDFTDIVEKNNKVAILTDSRHNYKFIAEQLNQKKMGNRIMLVGSNLSYDDEIIVKDNVENFLNKDLEAELSIVVVLNEK